MVKNNVKTKELYKKRNELENRVNLQSLYGSYDFDEWLICLIKPQKKDILLDIGCGVGNHLIKLAPHIHEGIGIDTSEDLLKSCKEKQTSLGINNISFFNNSGDNFSFPNKKFDVILCNFAIYYMNEEKVFSLIKKHLKKTRMGFITGSPDENAVELMNMYLKITDYVPDVYKPGYSDVRKYESLAKKYFKKCQFYRFINPVIFPTIKYYVEYFKSTTLYQSSKDKVPNLLNKMNEEAVKLYEKNRNITITKIVDTIQIGD